MTVSAFFALNVAELPVLTAKALISSWYLFTISLATALGVSLIIVISGALVLSNWKKGSIPSSRVLDAPTWVYVSAWMLTGISIIACILGLTAISYAGHQVIIEIVS